jgi:hypothetical protein
MLCHIINKHNEKSSVNHQPFAAEKYLSMSLASRPKIFKKSRVTKSLAMKGNVVQ